MARFLDAEKVHQVAFKADSSHLTPAARANGIYKGRPRPFCLPAGCAEQNLYPEIRKPALDYFAACDIQWHDGEKPAGGSVGKPSNHLCDSQVCCVNFLFPFADKPEALAALLRPIFPAVRTMLPMERPGQYVSYEWIGEKDYLREQKAGSGKRTRGANCTSADATVMFDCLDGTRQIVLIEWKYTESYSPVDIRIARRSGTDRAKIYQPLYDADDFPLRKELLPDFGCLFYEPFYQLMRQQMLANEMEKAGELGAGRVTLLHIAPHHNTDFPKVTSPELAHLGPTVVDVWKRLVKEPSRFASVSTETLFGCFPNQEFPELAAWWQYVCARYTWVLER